MNAPPLERVGSTAGPIRYVPKGTRLYRAKIPGRAYRFHHLLLAACGAGKKAEPLCSAELLRGGRWSRITGHTTRGCQECMRRGAFGCIVEKPKR